MSRPLSALALACLLFGCTNKKDGGAAPTNAGGPNPAPAEPKPDVSLTAAEYFKEYQADPKATLEKYKGKLVEIRATVARPHVAGPFNRLGVYGEIVEKINLPFIREFFLDSPSAGKEKELRLLARGQQVTIHGYGSDTAREIGLTDVRVVDSGPTTAVPITLAELAKAVADPAGREKFRKLDVLVRVKVVEPLPKDPFQPGAITDPDPLADGVKFLLRQPFAPKFKQEIASLKAGDVVTILGVYGGSDPDDTRLQLDGVRIVTSAPAGLSMPGGK